MDSVVRSPRPGTLTSGRFRTRSGAGFERAVSSAIDPVVLDDAGPGFFGEFRWAERSDVLVGRIANARSVARSSSPGSPDEARFVLCVQVRGTGAVAQDGRRTTIGPGGMAVYRTDRPYELEFGSSGVRVGAVVARSALGAGAEGAAALTAVRLDAGDALARAVGRAVVAFEDELGGAGERAAGRILDLVVQQFDAVVRERARAEWHGARERLHERALARIDADLADPELGVEALARRLFVSPRTLQLAFEGTGAGVAATIRERRLVRARTDLEAPDEAHVPIADVAARWGFPSASHFSVLVARRFGATPSALRRAARETVGPRVVGDRPS